MSKGPPPCRYRPTGDESVPRRDLSVARDPRHLVSSPTMTDDPVRQRVMELARERADWIPVLRAACEEAEASEKYGGQFASRWVLQRLSATGGEPAWLP